MNEIQLETIPIEYNECLSDSQEEESDSESDLELIEELIKKEPRADEIELESEEEEEEEGDYEDSDSDDDDQVLDFNPIIFALSDHFRFLNIITQTNSTTCLYKAIDRKTIKEVCIKISLTSSNLIPIEIKMLEYIRRLEGEKQNIQKLLNVFHQPDTAWVLVTEYVNSDRDYESKYLFGKEDKIRCFMTQLFKGLQFLHQHSIIHRDIKPSNLLWDDDKQFLVICDFDLACWNHSQKHQICVGTDSYICPSILAFDRDVPYERKNYGQEVDLYSSGCVFGGLQHSVIENDLKEKYIYSWRKRYMKKANDDDELFLQLVEHNIKKRITAIDALQSSYINKKPDSNCTTIVCQKRRTFHNNGL